MEILALDPAAPELASTWRDVLATHDVSNMLGVDVTCTYEWTSALLASHLGACEPRIAALVDGDEVVGIFPGFTEREGNLISGARILSPSMERYGGRCGFVFKRPYGDRVTEFFRCAIRGARDWDVLIFTLVDGSESEVALRNAARDSGFSVQTLARAESPYIHVASSWDTQLSGLKKKFRWTLKNGRKTLGAEGDLEHRVVTEESDCPGLLDAILEIERESWKEEAGTSISRNPIQERFYRALLPKAAAAGWLQGHYLTLNSEAVAYVLGLRYGGVFYDLKESYKLKFRSHSPGHVLKTFMFPELSSAGVRLYDFMGACDDYKMRWTSETYRRSTYAVFNRTLRGSVRRLRNWLHRKSVPTGQE